MGQEKYEVWFAGIRGLGARKKYLLHEALKSCRNAYYIEETQLKKFPFLTEKDGQEIRQAQKRKDPEKICEEMKKKGNVVPREDLIQALWDTEEFIDENTLTVNVARLRQRLKQIGVEELISTRKGVWYLIMEP